MRITVSLPDTPGGTEVTVLCDGIPEGVAPEDNEQAGGHLYKNQLHSSSDAAHKFSEKKQSLRTIAPIHQQNCHPDRSEAQWRDLRFRLTCNKTRFIPRGSATPVND